MVGSDRGQVPDSSSLSVNWWCCPDTLSAASLEGTFKQTDGMMT